MESLLNFNGYRHKKFDTKNRKRQFSEVDDVFNQSQSVFSDRPTSESGDSRSSEDFGNSIHNGIGQQQTAKRLHFDDSSNSSNDFKNSFTTSPPQRVDYHHVQEQLSPIATVPHNTLQIPQETLQEICKYHSNMARTFPKKERTVKDAERRRKNTIACRVSRRVKKLEEIAIEKQYEEYKQQHFQNVEKSKRSLCYLAELLKLTQMRLMYFHGQGQNGNLAIQES